MLKINFNRKILIICILLMFLAIPTAFAQDLSLDTNDSDLMSSDNTDSDSMSSANSNDAVPISNRGIADTDSQNMEYCNGASDSSIFENAINSYSQNTSSNDDNDEIIASYHQNSIMSASSGNVIYVGPKGNDIAGSGSLKNPYKTLPKAMEMANDGDAVCLLNGTYYFNDFYINKNITLMGESQENVILDGNSTYRICSINATDVSLVNLTFKNGYADANKRNGGAINSKVGGFLGIFNCTFINNRADTHGGAINIMLNYETPSEKLISPVFYVEGSTFKNNTAVMYGGAIHASANSYKDVDNKTLIMNTTILSSVFIDNTGGREQQHSISVSAYESTYFEMHDSIIIADSSKIISSTGAYKALVYYSQHSSRGEGYANVDGNWWGDNSNPADFNRTSNIDVNNWIIMQLSVSKSYVVATLDTVQTVDDKFLDYDSSALPKRVANYLPSYFFSQAQVDVTGGVAKNLFIGEAPQEVTVEIDNQELTITVEAVYQDYWYIGDTGYSTLADAVNAAQPGDIIKGVADVYTPDILGSEIIIDKDLTITTLTNGENDYVLLTSQDSRIFNVLDGVNLNLSNIIFENGGSTNGGAIYVSSGASVEIENAIFRKLNKASNGGAIYSEGDLTIINSQFQDLSSSSNGGAIFIENGNLNISDSLFSGISADGDGGAIYVLSGNNLIVSNSTFEDLSAINGGAIYSNAYSNNITKSKFVDNHASGNYDIIYADGNIFAENCIFVESPENDVCDVFASNPANAILNKNYWGTNSKPNSSKTNVDLDNWVILKLTLDEKLNLISVNTLHNLTIDFSQYTDGENNYTLENPLPEFGFDILVNAGEIKPAHVMFNESNVIVVNYTAPSSLSDEEISISKYSDQSLIFHVRTPVIYYWFIGDIGYESLQDAVDAAENEDTIIGVRFNHVYDYTVNINKNLTIKSNSTLARATFNGQYLDNIPILYISSDATVKLEDISFIGAAGSQNGGAIYNNGNLIIEHAIFNKNNGIMGGAIFNNGSLTIRESNFTYNNASSGGAVYNNGSLIIIDSSFANNTATDGAAVFNNGQLNVEKSNFTQNKAENNGGAIASIKKADVRNSMFLSNSASNGGAIYSRDADDFDDELIVQYSIFDGNDAQIGKAVAGANLFLDNNFWGLINYTNLIYNLSSAESIEPVSDFKFVISGPDEIGFGETAEFEIELQSITGDVSYLADYDINITTSLSNNVNINKININQGKVILNYIANQDIGSESIQLSGLSGIAGELKFTIVSLKTHFEYEDLIMLYNNGSTLDIYLKDEKDNILADKSVILYFNGERSERVTDSQGRVTIEIGDLEVGNYTGNISFEGETNYLASNASFKVEVDLIPTNIITEDLFIYYNNGSSLSILLYDVNDNPLSQMELEIQIMNRENPDEIYNIIAETTSGEANIPLAYSPGNYSINIAYGGDSHYESQTKSINLEIDKMPTVISGDDLNIYYGCSENLEVFLMDNNGNLLPNRNLSLAIIKSSDNSTIFDGVLSTDATGKIAKSLKLDIGSYIATVSFEETEFLYGCDKTININAVKMPTSIAVNTIILRAHEENNLIAYLSDYYGDSISNKTIKVDIIGVDNNYIDSYEINTDSEGKISRLISLAAGSYTIRFNFDGNDFYEASSREISQNVIATNMAYFEAEDVVMNVGNGSIIAYLKDPNGNPMEGELVTFDIGGTVLMNITDSEGKAVLNVDNPAGEYTVSIIFDGNDLVDAGLKTISLKVIDPNAPGNQSNESGENDGNSTSNETASRIPTNLVVSNMKVTTVVTSIQGKIGKYFKVTLKDKNNKALANKKIVISYNGKVYNRVTDSKGIAKLQINIKNKGTYTFAVTFLSDSQYLGSFAVAKIKVKPQKVKLKVKKKTFKASKKVKKLKATLKNAKGKAIKGKKITFTVNKKKYKAKTNKKGVATVKVKLSKKKTYKVTVKFAGDKTYKKKTKKSKVKIK